MRFAGGVPFRMGYDVEVVFSDALAVILDKAGPLVAVDAYFNSLGVRIKRILNQLRHKLY